MPSSIDKSHFTQARNSPRDPNDQLNIPGPRLGFYGVIDERFDICLLSEIARRRPDWHYIILGPVVKIDPALLPHSRNIHYLGSKGYDELPSYLGNWDVAIMPFAINDSTKFISPTKTPEFLTGGVPVVSTPISDVVSPYGEIGLVHIADDSESFINACEKALKQKGDQVWLKRVERFLAPMSWDVTCQIMKTQIQACNPNLQKFSTSTFS